MWQLKKKLLLLLKHFDEIFVLKSIVFWEVSRSSQMQNAALMHRGGLTLTARGSTLVVRI